MRSKIWVETNQNHKSTVIPSRQFHYSDTIFQRRSTETSTFLFRKTCSWVIHQQVWKTWKALLLPVHMHTEIRHRSELSRALFCQDLSPLHTSTYPRGAVQIYLTSNRDKYNKTMCSQRLRPKFHLARLDTTLHVWLCRASQVDTTRHVRLCRAVLFQHGGRRRSSSACMYEFSVLYFECTCKSLNKTEKKTTRCVGERLSEIRDFWMLQFSSDVRFNESQSDLVKLHVHRHRAVWGTF